MRVLKRKIRALKKFQPKIYVYSRFEQKRKVNI